MIPLSQQLVSLSERAGFTRSDMALWCETGICAMYQWMRRGVAPHPIKLEHLQKRIALLEKALRQDKRLPVPAHLHFGMARREYITGVRDHALGISKTGAAERRV